MVLILQTSPLNAQDDLMNLLNDEAPATDYAYATFKTTRLVLGQSVESPAPGTLQFLIEHNFGRINEGAYEFFGLDKSTIRLGLEYGINDWLSVSIGRSNFEKTVDGAVKAKVLRQSTGKRNMPISLIFYSSTSVNGLKWQDETRTNYFSSRLAFCNQLLLARKFSNAFSFQLTPTMIHKNLVATRNEPNDIYALGAGGRIKLTQRTSLNAEYFHTFNGNDDKKFKDAIAVGFDIETGGHVFQLRVSNSQPMFERAFITETTGDITKGDIYFGFTVNRVFTIVKPKSFREN
ncbi:MAG: hypothetical protein IPH84_09720 [Bacteroidales bacterium]|nr:hypothetical protein [Bacteroidales bacterium]